MQGFIDSIRELLQVRSHAEELHAEISNVDSNVKETTEGMFLFVLVLVSIVLKTFSFYNTVQSVRRFFVYTVL